MSGIKLLAVVKEELFDVGIGFEGLFLVFGSREIDDDLGIFGIDVGEFGEGCFGSDLSYHECGKHTIASWFVRENDVTGLLSAEFDMVGFDSFGDIGIADWCNLGVNVPFLSPT